MYASVPKSLAPLAPLDLIISATTLLDVSVIAIGVITLDNAVPEVESGADAVTVIPALYDAPHGEQATAALATLFENP